MDSLAGECLHTPVATQASAPRIVELALAGSAALDIALYRRSLVYPLGVSRRFWAAACVLRGRLT
jgi:hypothetical protein